MDYQYEQAFSRYRKFHHLHIAQIGHFYLGLTYAKYALTRNNSPLYSLTHRKQYLIKAEAI